MFSLPVEVFDLLITFFRNRVRMIILRMLEKEGKREERVLLVKTWLVGTWPFVIFFHCILVK